MRGKIIATAIAHITNNKRSRFLIYTYKYLIARAARVPRHRTSLISLCSTLFYSRALRYFRCAVPATAAILSTPEVPNAKHNSDWYSKPSARLFGASSPGRAYFLRATRVSAINLHARACNFSFHYICTASASFKFKLSRRMRFPREIYPLEYLNIKKSI